MQLKLSEQLKLLRRKNGRTQEDLAAALDVTPQAVSRWERGFCCPDMALIPAIANYFGVSIDELFGYKNDRDKKIDAIIERVANFHIDSRGDDEWVDECLGIIRSGLAEFPQNERLLILLAETLSSAGWRRHHEWLYYDEEGCIRHDYDRHRKNIYWSEAVEICENLASTTVDNTIATRAIKTLVLLYRNLGEYEHAVDCAKRMPELKNCREVLLAAAVDGKDESRYIGELLLGLAHKFAEQLVYGLVANARHYESDMPIEKLKFAISMFHTLCDDGNFGQYNGILIELHLYLSRVQWERGCRDDAFASLDEALRHARALDALADGEPHALTAPLVKFVVCPPFTESNAARSLPDDWPWWTNPDYAEVEAQIKSDPRWDAWVDRCRAVRGFAPNSAKETS